MGKHKLTAFTCLITLLALPVIGADSLHAEGVEESQRPRRSQVESAKITIGAVEDIVLSPWGVSFPARIDTGAELSSLDARDIVVENDVVEFKLGKRWGSRRFRLPVLNWRHVRTSMGTEKRPVVEISICLGSKLFRTLVTLRDRSEMTYPFLVGRSTLSDHFLVDPSRSRAVQPACPSSSLASTQPPSPTKE